MPSSRFAASVRFDWRGLVSPVEVMIRKPGKAAAYATRENVSSSEDSEDLHRCTLQLYLRMFNV